MSDQPNAAVPRGKRYEVKLKWPMDSGIQSVYANHFAISQTGPEYVLEFGEFLPTGFYNRPEEEIQEQLKNATIKVVARIVVSSDGLKSFFDMLDGYLKQHPIGIARESPDD